MRTCVDVRLYREGKITHWAILKMLTRLQIKEAKEAT